MPTTISGTEAYTGGAYQKPVAKDTGDVVASVIESFMERIANHTHTGQDSKDISLNIAKDTTLYQSGGVDFTWTSVGSGLYRATLDLPAAATYSGNLRRYFYAPVGTLVGGTAWKEFYPSTEYVSATTFYLYSNNNTIDLKILTV